MYVTFIGYGIGYSTPFLSVPPFWYRLWKKQICTKYKQNVNTLLNYRRHWLLMPILAMVGIVTKIFWCQYRSGGLHLSEKRTKIWAAISGRFKTLGYAKNKCYSQTNGLKSIKFCVYYCKGHVYMYAKYQGAQLRDS